MVRGDGDILASAENIDELKTDEFHVLLFHQSENIVFGKSAHILSSFSFFCLIKKGRDRLTPGSGLPACSKYIHI
jgi:hypothetical protein